jgi:hypothetical protein
MEEKLFTPKDVRTHLNISVANFSNWTTRGLIKPKYPANRQGSSSRFTYRDVIKTKLFIDLMEAGLTSKLASEVAFNSSIDDGWDTRDEYRINHTICESCILSISLTDIEESLK